MTIYPTQTKVKLDGGIQGVITGIYICSNGVKYKITWWNGRDIKEDYFYSWQFTSESYQTTKIGFYNQESC